MFHCLLLEIYTDGVCFFAFYAVVLLQLGVKASEFNGVAIAHSSSSFASPCATHGSFY